jgi:hypothetical protein
MRPQNAEAANDIIIEKTAYHKLVCNGGMTTKRQHSLKFGINLRL